MPYFMHGMGQVAQGDCLNPIEVASGDKLKRVDLEAKGCTAIRQTMTSTVYCCAARAAEMREPVGGKVAPALIRDVLVPTAALSKIRRQVGSRCEMVKKVNGVSVLRCDVSTATKLSSIYGAEAAAIKAAGGARSAPPPEVVIAPAPPPVLINGNGAPPPTLINGNGAPPPTLVNGNGAPPNGIMFEEQTFLPGDEGFVDRTLNWMQENPLLAIGGAVAVAVGGYFVTRGVRRRRNP